MKRILTIGGVFAAIVIATTIFGAKDDKPKPAECYEDLAKYGDLPADKFRQAMQELYEKCISKQ
jgi:hypothetical protein